MFSGRESAFRRNAHSRVRLAPRGKKKAPGWRSPSAVGCCADSERAAEADVYLIVEVAIPRHCLGYGVYLEVTKADEPERWTGRADTCRQVKRIVSDVVRDPERQNVRRVKRAESQ